MTGSFGSAFALRAQFEVDRGQVAGGAAHGQARHDARPVLVAHEDHAPHWRSRRRSPCSGMSLSTTAPYFVFTPSKEPSESRFELQMKTRSRGLRLHGHEPEGIEFELVPRAGHSAGEDVGTCSNVLSVVRIVAARSGPVKSAASPGEGLAARAVRKSQAPRLAGDVLGGHAAGTG